MAKEPNVAKGAVKKPPGPAPGAKPPAAKAPSQSVKGKVVRKDVPADAATQEIPNETADFELPKPAPKSAADIAGKKKIVRKDLGATRPLAEGTVDFEMPADDAASEDAAAAYLTQAFDDDDAPAAPPAQSGTVAFEADALEPAAATATAEESPPGSSTQAFTGDTIDSEMPKPGGTQQLTNDTIDTDMPKAPAKRAAPARPAPSAGNKKEGSMATIFNGRYKLLKELGKGGMGSVYKAQDIKFERVVAVKVLAKELSDKDAYVKRFEREGRVMIKLDHPNVIRCFDFDQDKKTGHHYLAIEFVDGGSVEGWLKKLGKFSVGDALHIIIKAATGLHHAHEKSLIHRDVKPDNLLMTKDGIVKVADLGLAKDTDEDTSLTKTGSGAGTPIYMAPEQARDVKHVDARVDIYALGVMLYVFLTGTPPFAGNTLVELISAKEKGKFDPMRKHNDEVPPKLDLIVDKMIAKDPKNRYATCQEVIDELEPLGLANEVLSFIDTESRPAAATMMPGPKAAATSGPGKIAAKTSVGGAAKGPAAKTTAPSPIVERTAIADDDVETNVWYWKMVTPSGKEITKKVTTEQVRTLIKAGHLGEDGILSKSMQNGYRAAASYPEFQANFKALKTATKANIKGAKYRSKMQEIAEEDAHRRKYGWLNRMFKSFGSTVVGLLWIVLILAIVGAAGYLGWTYLR